MAANNQLAEYNDLLDLIILENPQKGIQYRLAISEFRGVLYLGVREWYADFENKFSPTSNGFSMPYTLHSSSALFQALKSLLSQAETLEEVKENTLVRDDLIKRATIADQISLVTAIPLEFLHSSLEGFKLQDCPLTGKPQIVSNIHLPDGSIWLK